MTSVAIITTVIIVWCCFGLSYEIVGKGSCESCGRECKDVCGTKQFRPCCFNYLKKRKVDREFTDIEANGICQQCGKECSIFCATKLFRPCCYHQEKRRECKLCGSECENACGTKYFRTCCYNYNKKRSVDNPLDDAVLPLQLLMIMPEEEEYNALMEEGSSPPLHMYYQDIKTEQNNED